MIISQNNPLGFIGLQEIIMIFIMLMMIALPVVIVVTIILISKSRKKAQIPQPPTRMEDQIEPTDPNRDQSH